jgi:hypothetical protein
VRASAEYLEAAKGEEVAQQLAAQGYKFRLVVASPPHEVAVDVEGLGTELLDHMISRLPNDLDKLPPRPVPIGVTGIEIDRIQVALIRTACSRQ